MSIKENKMFPLKKEGAKTRKHFSIVQKTFGNGFGCKALSICL